MSYINAEIYDAFIAVGASEEKAKAAAGSIPAGDYLATKEDLQRAFATCKDEIADFRGYVKDEFANVKIETANVKIEVAQLRTDMHRTAWAMGVGIVVVLSILDRLLA